MLIYRVLSPRSPAGVFGKSNPPSFANQSTRRREHYILCKLYYVILSFAVSAPTAGGCFSLAGVRRPCPARRRPEALRLLSPRCGAEGCFPLPGAYHNSLRGCRSLFFPGADRGLVIPSPVRGGAFLFRHNTGPVRPCGGHTFSPAAERKYQRDAAREGLFTETPLSGLSLLRGNCTASELCP